MKTQMDMSTTKRISTESIVGRKNTVPATLDSLLLTLLTQVVRGMRSLNMNSDLNKMRWCLH